MFRLYSYSFLFSAITGFLWIGLAHLILKMQLPFRYSGIFTGLFFLPVFFAGEIELRTKQKCPTMIGLSEILAASIAGFLGPFAWMSFQFGLAQGLLGEAAFRIARSRWLLILGVILADCLLLGLHPKLRFFWTQSREQWLWHLAFLALSTLIVALLVKKLGFQLKIQPPRAKSAKASKAA